MKCYGCGVCKDVQKEEVYPYPDEDGITDSPISPFFVVECESSIGWKAVVVCHECFHRLQPDLWIGERCWLGINPVVPLEKLPNVAENFRWSVSSYPEL